MSSNVIHWSYQAEKWAREGLAIRRCCNDVDVRAAEECLEDVHKGRSKAGLPPSDWQALRRTFCSNLGCVNKGKLSVCVRCRTAKYCSSECQKVDWRYVHKKACKESGRSQ